MVARPGFEPGTLWLKVKCSTNWASEPNIVIKNGCLGWTRTIEMSESKSDALPLGYEAIFKEMVEGHGFEPWNPKEQIYSLPRLTTSLSLQSGAERGTRTPNPLITSQLRYQLRYFGIKMVDVYGLEPQTLCL